MSCTSITPRHAGAEGALAAAYALTLLAWTYLFLCRPIKRVDCSLMFHLMLAMSLLFRAAYWLAMLCVPTIDNDDQDELIFVYLKGLPTILFFGGFCLVIRQWQRAFESAKCGVASSQRPWALVDKCLAFTFVVSLLMEFIASLLQAIFPEDCIYMTLKGLSHCIMFSIAALGFATCAASQIKLLFLHTRRKERATNTRTSKLSYSREPVTDSSSGSSISGTNPDSTSSSGGSNAVPMSPATAAAAVSVRGDVVRRQFIGVIVSMMCVAIFLLRAVWTIYRHAGGQWPGTPYMVTIDLCYYTLLELLPAALLAFLLAGGGSGGAGGSAKKGNGFGLKTGLRTHTDTDFNNMTTTLNYDRSLSHHPLLDAPHG